MHALHTRTLLSGAPCRQLRPSMSHASIVGSSLDPGHTPTCLAVVAPLHLSGSLLLPHTCQALQVDPN